MITNVAAVTALPNYSSTADNLNLVRSRFRAFILSLGTLSACAATYAADGWILYTDPQSGLAFYYPKGWGQAQNQDSDALVQMQGTESGGYFAEVKLNKPSDGSPEAVLKMVESTVFPQMKNSKIIFDNARTKLGARSQFVGSSADVAFNLGALRVRQQYNFLKVGDKTYTLVFTAPEASYARASSVFNQILGTVDLRKAGSVPGRTQVRAQAQTELVPVDGNPEVPIKFAYPVGWRMSRDNRDEQRGWKFSGKNSEGHDAELFLYTMPRGEYTLEQLITMVEDEHLKPLPKYQRVGGGTRRYGSADGQTHVSTFLVEGLPGRQVAFYFIDHDRFYALALNAVAWTPEGMQSLFDRVASSIKF